MKRVFSLFLFLFFSFDSFAQENQNEKEYKWEIGLQINSLDKIPSLLDLNNPSDNRIFPDGTRKNKSFAFGVQVGHALSKKYFLRFRSGMTINNIYEYNEDTLTSINFLGKSYIHITNKNFSLSPGIFFIGKLEHFDLFCGIELPVILYGQVKDTMSFELYERITDSLISYGYSNANSDNGFATGPAFTSGFNIHLGRHFSLRGEISCAFLYSRVGKMSRVTVFSNGPTIVSSSFKDSAQTFFLPSQRFSLSFNFHF